MKRKHKGRDARLDSRGNRVKDLVRLVNQHDDSIYGVQTRMRTSVAEVITVPPTMLAEAATRDLLRIGDLIVQRACDYVVAKINSDLLKPEENRMRAVGETVEHWKQLGQLFRELLAAGCTSLEQFIYNEIYSLDLPLFEGGFVRFAHQKGLDCANLAGSKQLEPRAAELEVQLQKSIEQCAELEHTCQELDAAAQELQDMEAWFDDLLNDKDFVENIALIAQTTPDLGKFLNGEDLPE